MGMIIAGGVVFAVDTLKDESKSLFGLLVSWVADSWAWFTEFAKGESQTILAIGSLGTAIAAVVVVLQLHRNRVLTSVDFAAQALKEFAKDYDMQMMFYQIEYKTFKYDDGFHRSFREYQLDKLLRHFTAVALAWDRGLVRKKDLDIVRYYVLVIVGNKEVWRYVKHVRAVAKEKRGVVHPYGVLVKLSRRLHPPPTLLEVISEDIPI